MRCRQLLSLSVTLATLLVLVKCETPGNTSFAQEKAFGDQYENKTAIDDRTAPVNASATVNVTETATDSTTEKFKPTTNSTAHQTTQTPKGNETMTTPKGNETMTTPKGNETTTTTIKPPVKVNTTTPKPHNSTSSALTALSAVTLCVLSLTVSL